MTKVLSNIKLPWKLAAMLAIPLVSLAWFAGSAALNEQAESNKARQVVSSLDVVKELEELVYGIQFERGVSGLYLSNAEATDAEIGAQHAKVDEAHDALKAAVGQAGTLPEDFTEALEKLNVAVESLADLRAKVRARDIEPAGSAAAYTAVISTGLDTAAGIRHMVATPDGANDANVFMLVFDAIEAAGRTRAQLTPAFAAQKLSPEKAIEVGQAVGAEAGFLMVAQQNVGAVGAEALAAALESPEHAESERLRTAALAGEFPVAAPVFFEAISSWMDVMGSADLAILEGLEHMALQEASDADSQFWTQAVIAVIAVLLSVGLAVAVAVATIRPLREIAGVAETVATGDVDVEVGYVGRDEVGVLAESFRQLVAYVRDVAAAADALAAGDASKAVAVRGDADALGRAFVSLQSTLDSLTGQIRVLVDAAKAGDLDARGDAAGFEGAYREMVAGINATLEATAGPVGEAQRVLARVSDRDLTARMDGQFAGAFADIKESMNRAVANLDDGLGIVAMSAGQVSGAAHQISGGASSLSAAATEQAASLEEISANLSELSAMAKSAAEQVHDAQDLASQSDRLTSEGADAMAELSDAITRIKESADATAGIVRTIDEIAFQTNLLSLNAAVEAARAGDAGKGFAVVAEEVRNLAMRSAEAAKNTAELIEGSVTHADAGVVLNHKVSANLEQIGGAVRSINETMGQVAAATQEQTTGVGQITEAVEELNRLTQDNAAQAEEAAASSEELTAQAAEMAALAGAYKLTGTAGTAPTPPATATAAPGGAPFDSGLEDFADF